MTSHNFFFVSKYKQSCIMECIAKVYLSYCQCILYYMPRFESNITICGRSDDDCVKKVALGLQNQKNNSFVCDCLPGCFEVIYEAGVSMTPLLKHAPILTKNHLYHTNVSVMQIYYQNNYFRSQIKDELIDLTDFLYVL